MFPEFFSTISESKTQVLVFTGGPGGVRELREADRNYFHLSWYLIVPGIASYDQKTLEGFFPNNSGLKSKVYCLIFGL